MKRNRVRDVGRGGPLVKHFLAELPPVTAPTRQRSNSANAYTYYDIARCRLDAATRHSYFAATTADHMVLRVSAPRIHNSRLGIADTPKRVRVRRCIVKNPTKPVKAQTVLREDCPKAMAESVYGIAQETDGWVSCAQTSRVPVSQGDNTVKISKKKLKRMRMLDKEDSWAGPTTGRWLWDESRKLRDKNLRKFWFKWDNFTILTPMQERYGLLTGMASQVYVVHNLGKLHNRRTRNRFNIFKDNDFPLDGQICGCCGGPAEVRHHIVPIKNGGHNHLLNMMPMCNSCHCEIHPWLNKHDAERKKTGVYPNEIQSRGEEVGRERSGASGS